MDNKKDKSIFIGHKPDDENFSEFFYGLNKQDQLDYMGYLERTSVRHGAKGGLFIALIISMFLIAILGNLLGWYPNDF